MWCALHKLSANEFGFDLNTTHSAHQIRLIVMNRTANFMTYTQATMKTTNPKQCQRSHIRYCHTMNTIGLRHNCSCVSCIRAVQCQSVNKLFDRTIGMGAVCFVSFRLIVLHAHKYDKQHDSVMFTSNTSRVRVHPKKTRTKYSVIVFMFLRSFFHFAAS